MKDRFSSSLPAAMAAVLENLTRIAPVETLKIGLVDFHSWRWKCVVF